MNTRREFEARLQQRNEVEPLNVDLNKLTDHIADVCKLTCDALVKRGFSEEAAVYLAAQIVPNIM